MTYDCDICIIGSGAGGGPVAYSAAHAGKSVIVLEKGPWLKEVDFPKDEIADCRRDRFGSRVKEEPHVVTTGKEGDLYTRSTADDDGWNFWNGNMVGGATNLMSGFFQRLKPVDFKLRSTLGPIEDANLVDWPIGYDQLEPYYDKVEKVVGVSGRVVPHPFADKRSSPEYAFPALNEHPLANWIDRTGAAMGLHPVPLARAVLPHAALERYGCSYNGFCGSYGCATGAKGSSRAALLDAAVRTGKCRITPHAKAIRIITDSRGLATAVEYHDPEGRRHQVTARAFAVACQSIETSRLLLLSTGPKHSNGLGNDYDMLGRYLLFSTAASVDGNFTISKFDAAQQSELRNPQPFINRTLQDFYLYRDERGQLRKGGSLDFMFTHPNPISAATYLALSSDDKLLWGEPLKKELLHYFRDQRHLMVEIFSDWMPVPHCRVTLDSQVKDRWGIPSAHVRIGRHPLNKASADHLVEQAANFIYRLGAEDISSSSRGAPAMNLLAGGCRFGTDPRTSVLDPNCRVHSCPNVFVTDGSFMPNGGSVPYTWTIYANSFRVADQMVASI